MQLTCVSADMFLEIAGRLECFITVVFWTFVGFLPCVYTRVTLEAIPCRERLPTCQELTLEWPVPSMRSLMNLSMEAM